MDWIIQAEKRPKYKSAVPALRDFVTKAESLAPDKSVEPSWALGYRRARAMRKAMALSDGNRFSTLKQLTKLFGASDSYSPAVAVNGIRAVRQDDNDQIFIHLRNHGKAAP